MRFSAAAPQALRRAAPRPPRRASASRRKRSPPWSGPVARPGLKDSTSRPTESFESLHIRIPLKFCQNSGVSQSFRNSEKFSSSQHFQECSAKFREEIIKIGIKFDQNRRTMMTFFRNSNTNTKKFVEFCEYSP